MFECWGLVFVGGSPHLDEVPLIHLCALHGYVLYDASWTRRTVPANVNEGFLVTIVALPDVRKCRSCPWHGDLLRRSGGAAMGLPHDSLVPGVLAGGLRGNGRRGRALLMMCTVYTARGGACPRPISFTYPNWIGKKMVGSAGGLIVAIDPRTSRRLALITC